MKTGSPMLAIKGIYNGNSVELLGERPLNKKYKVVVTFVEELDDEEDLRTFTSQFTAFDFWNDKREDLYQDYLPKRKR
jgi:hypothetical protein